MSIIHELDEHIRDSRRGWYLGDIPGTQRLLGGAGVEPADPVATMTVTTTTSPQTLTINSLGVAAGEEVLVDWGDGSDNTYSGTALRTHSYATAGTYTVTIHTPEHVRILQAHTQSIIQALDVGACTALTDLWCYSTSISALDVSTNTALTDLRCNNNGWAQAAVDSLLLSAYTAAIAPRTGSGGTINVGGTNAAPSGTLQPAASCPVDGSTPGKEIAHELANDGCGEGFNVWTTVTITT
jgi:hypothetical protein